MRWYCGLLLWVLRLLLFTEQERISTTCAAATAIPYSQSILWPAAANVLLSTNVRAFAHVRATANVRRRRSTRRTHQSIQRSTKRWLQRRRAPSFPHAHPRSPIRRHGNGPPPKPTSKPTTRPALLERQRRLLRPRSRPTNRRRRLRCYERRTSAQLRLSPAICATVALQSRDSFASPESRHERAVDAV